MELAMVLAIVVLGGMGSQLGVALAAAVMLGGFEFFREFAQYRMLVFGARHGGDHDLAAARPGGDAHALDPLGPHHDVDAEIVRQARAKTWSRRQQRNA